MFVLIFTLSALSHQTIASSASEWPDYENDVVFHGKKHDSFDWNFTKVALSSDSGNVIVSPYSLKLLLSLVQQGAGKNSQTYEELSSTILPGLNKDSDLYSYWKKTLSSLTENNKYYELNIASQIYFNESIHLKSDYKKLAESVYHSPSDTLNFDDTKKATEDINAWVSDKTKGHIKELVKEGDVKDSVAILLNAIYFQGTWELQFPKKDTTENKFYTSSDKSINANFMFRNDDYLYADSESLGFEMIRLPYKGNKFAMYVIFPRKQDGLQTILDNITPKQIQELQYQMQYENIYLYFPKFKFDYGKQLKEDLEKLNIKTMFSSDANFNNISDVPLQVSSVKQKAGIIVDEVGTTAYATSDVGFANRILIKHNFTVDHPFIFFIEDETTGTLIFAGKVEEPKF